MHKHIWFLLLVLCLISLAACAKQPLHPNEGSQLNIVATTTIVSDVVKQVAGDQVEVITLLPYNADPHTYEATPQDLARLAKADGIFANGAGLETFLSRILSSAGADTKVTYLSDGIELLQMSQELVQVESDNSGEEHDLDPHVWTDPNNIKIWADNAAAQLSRLDPANQDTYLANAENYKNKLSELDNWIRQQVTQIPQLKRLIVSDHLEYSYFARRYDFTLVGALIPSFSTVAEPSAQELARLESQIKTLGVEAIFTSVSINPTLAERVVEDTGVKLVYIYSGSLSKPGGEASTYLDYIHFNVSAMVNALR
jgi:ABC-type Zn uptake system ZnuABC Zn-binding protein ZnuA